MTQHSTGATLPLIKEGRLPVALKPIDIDSRAEDKQTQDNTY